MDDDQPGDEESESYQSSSDQEVGMIKVILLNLNSLDY